MREGALFWVGNACRAPLIALIVIAGAGCEGDGATSTMDSARSEDSGSTNASDADEDGWDDRSDCDDSDESVHPGATEVPYDGVDQDCVGGDLTDVDGDGYDAVEAGGLDCDDGDVALHPGAGDVPYDGVDADCGGTSDYDADGDGHDAVEYGGDDCDDTDVDVHPGVPEQWYDGVDDDCDGGDDFDFDGDGHRAEAFDGDDCQDADPAIHPGAEDAWYDGVDSNCDDASDYDADGDGYLAEDYGWTDCNDADAAINPAADEVDFDGVDQDCDAEDYELDGRYAGTITMVLTWNSGSYVDVYTGTLEGYVDSTPSASDYYPILLQARIEDSEGRGYDVSMWVDPPLALDGATVEGEVDAVEAGEWTGDFSTGALVGGFVQSHGLYDYEYTFSVER